jgi:hypothetical protein
MDERSVESPSVAVWQPGGEQSSGPNVCEPLQPREIGAERRRGRAGHFAAKARDWVWIRRHPGPFRGTGGGTERQCGTEQERPYPSAVVGQRPWL